MSPAPKTWTHDDLGSDLADHLRGGADSLVWENMQLGMSGSARPDVFTMARSFVNPRPVVYEVKVSRADFLRDVGAGKWLAYFDFATAVYFAVPAGLIAKGDVPPEAGLYVRGPEGWRALKAARPRRLEAIPEVVLLKLVIDGIDRVVSRKAFRGRDPQEYLNRCALVAAAERRFGAEAGKAMSTWANLRDEVSRAEARLAALRARYDEEAAEQATKNRREREECLVDVRAVAAVLGVPSDASPWEVRSALRDARSKLDESAVVRSARNAMLRACRSLQGELEHLQGALAQVGPHLAAADDDEPGSFRRSKRP